MSAGNFPNTIVIRLCTRPDRHFCCSSGNLTGFEAIDLSEIGQAGRVANVVNVDMDICARFVFTCLHLYVKNKKWRTVPVWHHYISTDVEIWQDGWAEGFDRWPWTDFARCDWSEAQGDGSVYTGGGVDEEFGPRYPQVYLPVLLLLACVHECLYVCVRGLVLIRTGQHSERGLKNAA